jgi:hypothetical protein
MRTKIFFDIKHNYKIYICGAKLIFLYQLYNDTIENYNGLDAIHTEREYRTGLKLKKNELDQKSDIIADGYTIEYTRRKSVEPTADWRYDNDIFIFCLTRSRFHGEQFRYAIDSGARDTDGTIISPNTVYNIRISPARMAMRWLNRLVSFGFGKEEELIFTSGTGNLQAKGSAVSSSLHHPDDYPDTDDNIYTENQRFSSATPVFFAGTD